MSGTPPIRSSLELGGQTEIPSTFTDLSTTTAPSAAPADPTEVFSRAQETLQQELEKHSPQDRTYQICSSSTPSRSIPIPSLNLHPSQAAPSSPLAVSWGHRGDISAKYARVKPLSRHTSVHHLLFLKDKPPELQQTSPLDQLGVSPRFSRNVHTTREQSSSSSSSTDAPLTERGFRTAAPMFFSITNHKVKFSGKEACEQLLSCLNRPGGPDLVLNFFSQLHSLEDAEWYVRRWDVLLAELILRPQTYAFIHQFIKSEGIKIDPFAKRIVEGFQKMRPPASLEVVILLFAFYTHEELRDQTPETLFRGTNLSSSLYKEYGHHLLQKTLKKWEKEIRSHWKKTCHPDNLCLSLHAIRSVLLKNRKGFDKLPIAEQEECCLQTQRQNIENCKGFFRYFLEQFYNQPITEEFRRLIVDRRELIFSRLMSVQRDLIYSKLTPPYSPEIIAEAEAEIAKAEPNAIFQSEVGSCEIVFLRLLNPWLLSLAKKDPIHREALLNLTKMIQALANQVQFGDEKRDEVFEEFKPVYSWFIEIHRFWIHNNFPMRLILLGSNTVTSSSSAPMSN